MAESGLALTNVNLMAETGNFLGYGWGSAAPYSDIAWDTRQTLNVNSCVSSGLRRFYVPEPAAPGGSPYVWSFLKPTASLTLLSGINTLALPDDFGGIEGRPTLSPTSANVWHPLPVVGDNFIQALNTRTPTATGRPLYLAVRATKGTQPTYGQRFELLVYPTPDADYTLVLDYYVLPEALTPAFPYHLGGAAHSETVLESCLAVAEERFDDESTVHREAFARRLAASIGYDRQLRPQLTGYNGDNSDQRNRNWRRADLHGWNQITVDGTTY